MAIIKQNKQANKNKNKPQKTVTVDKDVEKLECLVMAGGNIK